MTKEKEFKKLLDTKRISYKKDGNSFVANGYLDLEGTNITSLPNNLTVGGNLYIRGTNITSLPEGLVVGGGLDLSGTNITSLQDNLTVGGYLDLRGTNITSLPEGLVVGGDLYISGTNITSLPEGLVVGGDLYLCRTKITTLPDNLTVGENLDLRETNITSLPDNLTVGRGLDLEGTNITSLPEGLVVGGNLYIRGTNITSLPEGLVQEDIYVQNKLNKLLSWKKGKYRKFDGIFCEVIRELKSVLKVKINGEVAYIVTDGNVYSHGKTVKEAKENLLYKISSRDTSKFKKWGLDTKISLKEAIESYRIITGACEFGTKNFVTNNEEKIKKLKYITPLEIIKLTRGQFGTNKYYTFFEKKCKKYLTLCEKRAMP